jgi:branched-subunit amino acid ABC-type transport system permease component
MLLGFPDLQPFVVTGVALGAVYAMSGVGIVVLYRATGVLNFAYGAVGALGALVSWSLVNQTSCPDPLAYLVAVAFGGITSLVYGMLFGPPLAQRDPLVKAMGTLAVSLIFLGIMSWVWSDDPRSLVLPTTRWSYQLGEARVSWTQIIAIALGLGVTAGTVTFLRMTKLGTAMRSLANDREITAMLGVPVRRVEAAAWLGSGLLCGATGLLLSNMVALDGVALTFLVISALGAALIGRLHALWTTLVAGLAIGLVEACLTPFTTSSTFTSLSQYRSMTPFVFAIIALLWLARRRVVTLERATATGQVRPARPYRPLGSGLLGSAIDRWTAVRVTVVAGLLAFVLLGLPAATNTYWIQVATTVAIYSVVALGAGLLYGRVGLISLCQIALLAVGGWVALRLAYATSLPFPLLLLFTGLATAVIGVFIGLPALRLTGLYLALVTLMAAGAISVVLTVIKFPNGGGGFLGQSLTATSSGQGMRRPDIAIGDTSFFRYAVIVCALMFALTLWHVAGRPGRAWAALRQSQPASLAVGLNITLYKLWAFALASFMTGVAGCLLAASAGGLSIFQFPTSASIQLLAAILIGGIFSLWGAIAAGIFMRLVPAFLQNWGIPADLLIILFGVGLIQVLLTAPGGVADQLPQDLAKLGQRIVRLASRVAEARGRAAA